MPKVESIRPGGILDGSVGQYPLADLFVGILRGNLTGRLYLRLRPESVDWICFRDGVPVQVVLPATGGPFRSAVGRQLQSSGRAAEGLARAAAESGLTTEEFLVQQGVVSVADLEELRCAGSRDQVIELFDFPNLEFRFFEGEGPGDGPLIILEPLSIVFAGLQRARAPNGTQAFIQYHGRSVFALSETFPRGVDPFGWGQGVQDVVVAKDGDLSIESLLANGLPARTAVAAVVSLHLSGMVREMTLRPGVPPGLEERLDPPSGTSPSEARASPAAGPFAAEDRPPPADARAANGVGANGVGVDPAGPMEDPSPEVEMELDGLTVLDRSEIPPRRPASTPPLRLESAEALDESPMAEFRSVEGRLAPLRHRSYFQLLRVTPETPPAQIERAYRFLVRRVDEEGDDPGWRASKDLLAEAYRVLSEPAAAKSYAELVERSERSAIARAERHALEAEPKVERALSVMALGRTGEARYLLAWAGELDPTRTDIGPLIGMAEHLGTGARAPTDEVAELLGVITREVAKNPHDWRVKLCQAVLYAESGDARMAHSLIRVSPDPHHPLAEYALRVLDGAGGP